MAVLGLAAPAPAQVVTARVVKPGWRPEALALYEKGNRLFVFDDATNSLFTFDATTLAELGSLPLPFDSVFSMQVDESQGKLYAGCWCPGAGPIDNIAVVDATGPRLLGRLASSGFTQLTGDEDRDRVYASYNGGVSAVDVATDAVTRVAGIAGGNLYTSMAVNPVTHELFVSNWSQNGDVLYVVSPDALAVSTVPDMAGFGVGVNWTENKAYVSYCRSAGFEGFCIYDRKTGGVKRFNAGNDSSQGMVHNPATNRMYSTVEVNRVSTVIEGADDSWFNVEVAGGGNTALGAVAATGHVYYVMPEATYVMDGRSTKVLGRFPVAGIEDALISGAVEVSQTTGRVYLLNDDDSETLTLVDDLTSAWLLPSSARLAGLGGAFYTTDVTLANGGISPADVTLKHLGHDVDGRAGPEQRLSIGPGTTRTFRDVLDSAFGMASGYGAIRITSNSPALSVLGQTSTPSGEGTFGQSVPAAPLPRWIDSGTECSIPGVREDAGQRTNLILSNATAEALDVDVSLASDAGASSGVQRVPLPPFGMTQLTQVLEQLSPSATNGRLVLSVLTPGGQLAAYASAIDNVTNDPRTLLPVCPDNGVAPGRTSWILPSSAHAPGAAGAFFTTDLTIANLSPYPIGVDLQFLGHDADGRSAAQRTFIFEPGESRSYADVLGSVFHATDDYGALRVSSSFALAVLGQTSTPGGGGSFGQSVTAFSERDLIRAEPRSIAAVREDAAFRTNLILANAVEVPLDVDVRLVSEGGATLAGKRYALPPLGMTQVTRVVRDLGLAGDVSGARLVLSTPTPGGAFAAYASAIDNVTNDPRTLLP